MTVLSPSCCNVNEFESHWNIILQTDVTETLSVDVSQPTKPTELFYLKVFCQALYYLFKEENPVLLTETKHSEFKFNQTAGKNLNYDI